MNRGHGAPVHALLTAGRQGQRRADRPPVRKFEQSGGTAVSGGLLRRIAWVGSLAASLALAAPAAAQTFSDGYQFLQTVEKQDINKADALLNKPGSVLINSRDL